MTTRYGFTKIERLDATVYESEDGQWRVINPWQSDTSLRYRWIVQQLMPDGEWFALDDDYITMFEAVGAVIEECGSL